ncbi:MAG: hypothetical protein HY077_17190 [Elusimicrobia bacterium]|nr:hypothetical protein [Elusimicrobiota bacterium]
MPQTLVYFLFAAAIFFFMGLGLACDAEHHAEAAAEWERLALGSGAKVSPGLRRRLAWAYRLGGAAFSGFGLWVAAAASWFPQTLLTRFKVAPAGPAGRLVSGLLFAALGILLATFKLGELARPARPPGGLGADLLAKPDWGRRLASASGWLVVLSFLALGLFLLSRQG